MNFLDEYFSFNLKEYSSLSDLTDEFFCVYINSYFNNNDDNIYIVCNTLYEANILYNSLKNYNDNIYLFPMDKFIAAESLTTSPEFKFIRLETINAILSNKKSIVITCLDGYLRFLPSVSTYLSKFIDINVNAMYETSKLIDKLIDTGYERVSLVSKTGEFSFRGFILDVFPIGEDNPVRIEFFDDVVESLRYFNLDDQRSIKKIEYITIKPVTEFLYDNKNIEIDIDNNKQKYLSKYESCVSLYEYLNNPVVFFKDKKIIDNSYKLLEKEVLEYNKMNDPAFKNRYFFDINDIKIGKFINYMSVDNYNDNDNIMKFNVKTINNFSENVDLINNYIFESINSGKTIIICLNKMQKRAVVKKLKMKINETDFNNIKLNMVNIVEKEFNSGFEFRNFVVLTANELFIQKNNKKTFVSKYKYSTAIKDINKLNVGDYIVHNCHGIGIYNGIKSLKFNDVLKDYIEIQYQGTDKVYLPIDKIDVIYKYSGQEGKVPKINRLGSSDWEKTKLRVRNRVSNMADELLKLYAEREMRKGYAFSKDCDMSDDFEKDIDFVLTKDQNSAIIDIKEDMEKRVPMDRLLCGDVGFGKTEVAFVAAFKAILDSKQVIFLCPTTILSKQHYDNALKRFKNFPVNIALLNRFTTTKEFNRIKEGVKDGTIDLVFGTHRLLSNELDFKDLGLLVVDEEQRFGVGHKEKIKQIKTNVDVLTLTATPIPRTLQMSLVGIRSLSLIETPPINRYPIQTYVTEENDYLVRDAIYNEMARNGQVFILYNRVMTIEEQKNKIAELVPDARICIVHGKMDKDELENTVYDFVNYVYDIMLCTTIIETGIDIPNVNTLIIYDADRFGLSQLYQIRGRIGRSDKFAYAYLMYKKNKLLTTEASKRLNAIKEFTELGSGFSIATRDLSIRGAGDILGSEQAGFIDSVGIDLYLKMLNDEVNKRRKSDFIEQYEEDNDDKKQIINVSTHIDDNYVDDDTLKIEVHKKINSIDSLESFEKIKSEIEDRFGKLNDDIIIYMYEEWFENLVNLLKIKDIRQTKNTIELYLDKEIINDIKVDDLFVDLYKITNMFRLAYKNNHLIVILDTIKLDKHPVMYLVEFLTLLNNKYLNKGTTNE